AAAKARRLYVRVPAWSPDTKVLSATAERGYQRVDLSVDIPQVSLDITPTLKKLDGGQSYPNCTALQRGPQVLCLDAASNPDVPMPWLVALAEQNPALVVDANSNRPRFTTDGIVSTIEESSHRFSTKRQPIVLTPFADAVAPHVWLRAQDDLP